MSGQQRQRERWRRAGERTEECEFNAVTRLAENTETGREEGMGQRFGCSADRLAFQKTAGGRQKTSRSRAAQCGFQPGPESYITE